MRTRIATFTLATTVAMLGIVSSARADDPVADRLYREGRQAMTAKDLALACQKFRESNDRERAPGTLLNLADCEEKRAQLTSAVAHFHEAARLFRAKDERATYALERAVAVERRLPRLSIRLHRDAPPDSTILRDGASVDQALLAKPVAVDPGEHVIVVRAPQRSDARVAVNLREGESREVEVSAGPPIASAPIASTSSASTPSVERAAPVDRTSLSSVSSSPTAGSTAARTIGFVALGVGAVGLGTGIVGGVATLDSKHTADRECTNGCTTAGLAAQDRGKAWSTVGTAGFVTAAVGLAAGAALLLFLPSKRGPQAAVFSPNAVAGSFSF